MKIISVCSQKGGVGKTAIAFHLGWRLYELGHTLLLIDMDPQGNLSLTFGKDTCSSMEIFTEKPRIKSEVVIGEGEDMGVSLVTSDFNLEHSNRNTPDRYIKLKKALSGVRSIWDYIIIDCPPAFGLFTRNAFMSSDYLLIPSLPLYYSLAGIKSVMNVAEGMKEEGINRKLKVLGIIVNQVERTIVHREALEILSDTFPSILFSTIIPKTIRVEEALQNKMPIWEYEEDNPASKALKNLAEEFVKKIEEASYGKEKTTHEGTLQGR